MEVIGGKGSTSANPQHTTKKIAHATPKVPVPKPQGKGKDDEGRHREQDGAMRKKVWVPPGGSGTYYGK